MGSAFFFFFSAPPGPLGGGILAAGPAVVAGEGALGPLPVGVAIGALQAQTATISGQGVKISTVHFPRQIGQVGIREYFYPPARAATGTYPTKDLDFTSAFQFQPPAFQTNAFQIFSLGETSSRARVAVSEG